MVSKYYFSERMFTELNSAMKKTETVNLSSSGPYPSHKPKANQLEKKGKAPLLQREAAERS